MVEINAYLRLESRHLAALAVVGVVVLLYRGEGTEQVGGLLNAAVLAAGMLIGRDMQGPGTLSPHLTRDPR